MAFLPSPPEPPSSGRAAAASKGSAKRVKAFMIEDSAATAVEYALMASLIAVTIAGICGMMFTKLSTEYAEISSVFS
jgi:Flp pilus assembly pilin Flp